MKTKLSLLFAGLLAAVMSYAAPIGSKGGRFTVDANGTQVRFAQGNLQYHVRNKVWQFAERQDSIIGESNEERVEANYNNWIDLFAWGATGFNGKNPEMHSHDNADYALGSKTDITDTNYDWGQYCAISNGGNKAGLWRTLTKDEWMYLFNNRTNASQLFGFGAVNDLHGLILLPDGWTTPAGGHFTAVVDDRAANNYTLVDWEIMENAGAIFLPDAGYATPNSAGTLVSWNGPINASARRNIGTMYSYYMSSTASSTSNAYYCFRLEHNISTFDKTTNKVLNPNNRQFLNENPVRLAMTVREYTVLFKGPQGETLLEVPVEYGCAVTPPTAPAWAGHTFKQWVTPDPMTLDYITGPTTFTAQYEEKTTYTIQFIDTYDNSVLKTQTVEPNAAATAPSEPSHTGYTFVSWDKDFSRVTGNMVVYPNYRYGILIAGEYITDLNRTNLSGIEGVTLGTGGSISFTPGSKTLILNNATITTPDITWGVFNASFADLRIEIRGTVDLHTPYCIAFRSDVNTTIVGAEGTDPLLKVRNDGPLDHKVGNIDAGMCYTALTTFPNSNLTIEDCTVQAEGAGGVKAQGASVITLKRVHLTTKVIGTPTSDKQRQVMYSFLANAEPVLIGCEPISPTTLTYSSSLGGFTVNGELTRGEMEIGMPTTPCQDKTYTFLQTACGEFTWNGQKYTESGTYTQAFQIEGGCDSVVTMQLTVHPTYDHLISVETNDNPYIWEGSSYTESGTYTKVLKTAAWDCDSIVTLSLTIGEIPEPTCETKFFEFNAEAESEYVWEGQAYNASGDYERIFKQIGNTCDSIVTLHLTIGGVDPTPTKTYYVAGNGTVGNPWCHGKYWKAAGSPMINGSITFYDVPAGIYLFKITDGVWGDGHEWAYGDVDFYCSSANILCGGNDNIKLITSQTQNITINFDGSKICINGSYEDQSSLEISVYTVVGDMYILGTDWDLEDVSNDMMDCGDGIYKLTKQNVTLNAGNYEYKIVGNRNYVVFEYPNQSMVIQISETGNYDITFTFNANTQELSHQITKQEQGVDDAAVRNGAVKVLRNGQLLILRDGKKYNILGTECKE